MLHIAIPHGKHLLSMDSNGLSDPYLRLGILAKKDFQDGKMSKKKRKKKLVWSQHTKKDIQMKTLNPDFKACFQVHMEPIKLTNMLPHILEIVVSQTMRTNSLTCLLSHSLTQPITHSNSTRHLHVPLFVVFLYFVFCLARLCIVVLLLFALPLLPPAAGVRLRCRHQR